MRTAGWVIAAMIGLGACATDEEWAGGPNTFAHEDAEWQIVKQGTRIAGQWMNAPPGVTVPHVRYQAIQAFRAYAGCKLAPSSLLIDGVRADALMRC